MTLSPYCRHIYTVNFAFLRSIDEQAETYNLFLKYTLTVPAY